MQHFRYLHLEDETERGVCFCPLVSGEIVGHQVDRAAPRDNSAFSAIICERRPFTKEECCLGQLIQAVKVHASHTQAIKPVTKTSPNKVLMAWTAQLASCRPLPSLPKEPIAPKLHSRFLTRTEIRDPGFFYIVTSATVTTSKVPHSIVDRAQYGDTCGFVVVAVTLDSNLTTAQWKTSCCKCHVRSRCSHSWDWKATSESTLAAQWSLMSYAELQKLVVVFHGVLQLLLSPVIEPFDCGWGRGTSVEYSGWQHCGCGSSTIHQADSSRTRPVEVQRCERCEGSR
ncbi:hypothetical protein FN846DRAFT_172560 [Sphaerosporella brunnea]|uniref:Uncharacterized protein n=1 Tax=Sphaerosporella brunnea TaxID=1250544 RepID=A0A5J5EPW2_9PEZI|nr:hypothetical protein FN846DRAFT_172560 [Sphaerosporella brunnea]